MIKYGVDEGLEARANEILYDQVGENSRSPHRDLEKVAYEKGFTPPEELQHYDPANDWDAQDSAYAIIASPNTISTVEPSLCSELDDGNTRSRNRKSEERRAQRRHLDDTDDWGSDHEDIPLLGVNEGPRKTCRQCKKPKGLSLFSPDARNSDGLRSWCRNCEKEAAKMRYTRKKKK